MSSSTISIQVKPGEAIARGIAARRAELDAQREHLLEHRTLVRERELMARSVSSPRGFARLGARTDVICSEGTASERAQAHKALERVEQGDAPQRAEEVLSALERAAARRSATRAEQEVTLKAALASLPGADSMLEPETIEEDDSGRLCVTTRLSNGGRLPLRADGSDGNAQRLTLVVAGSGLDRMVTRRGVLSGCDAQEAYAQMLCENLRARGIEATVEAGSNDETASTRRARAEDAREP